MRLWLLGMMLGTGMAALGGAMLGHATLAHLAQVVTARRRRAHARR